MVHSDKDIIEIRSEYRLLDFIEEGFYIFNENLKHSNILEVDGCQEAIFRIELPIDEKECDKKKLYNNKNKVEELLEKGKRTRMISEDIKDEPDKVLTFHYLKKRFRYQIIKYINLENNGLYDVKSEIENTLKNPMYSSLLSNIGVSNIVELISSFLK